MTSCCKICAKINPRFLKPFYMSLVKATQPMERLSINFKGSLPSQTKNKYILTVDDEYSRYPFAFSCYNIDSETVIDCLSQIFTLFGAGSFVHVDRAKSFMSNDLISYIATSRTSAYNPSGNGQRGKYNDIIWSAVQLALKTRNLTTRDWESVLPQSLHSIRSLLCTSTNATPHKRFLPFPLRSAIGVQFHPG